MIAPGQYFWAFFPQETETPLVESTCLSALRVADDSSLCCVQIIQKREECEQYRNKLYADEYAEAGYTRSEVITRLQ